MMLFNLSAVGVVLLALSPSTFLQCRRMCLCLYPAQFLLLALRLHPPLPLCLHHIRPFLEPIFLGDSGVWLLSRPQPHSCLTPHSICCLLDLQEIEIFKIKYKLVTCHISREVWQEGEIGGIKKLDSHCLRKFFYSWAALSGIAVWLCKPTHILNISSIFQGRFTSMHCWFENAPISLDSCWKQQRSGILLSSLREGEDSSCAGCDQSSFAWCQKIKHSKARPCQQRVDCFK